MHMATDFAFYLAITLAVAALFCVGLSFAMAIY